MPELPEAQTIATQLDQQLAGVTLGRVHLARPDIVKSKTADLEALVPGRRVVRVYRRAKRVVIDLDPAATIVFGLGMTGRLTVVSAIGEIEKHTHLRIALAGSNEELRFRDPRRFGGVWVRELTGDRPSISSEGDPLALMGVEPLECTPKQFRELLSRKRQIKALLMDQHAVAGMGNIYCDESLHAAAIHPLTRSHRLRSEEASKLLRSIKTILRRAIRFNGSTLMDYRDADGSEGSFQKLHRVYGREGESCKTCGTTIRRIQAAGRSTHFCPRCQTRRRD